MSELNAFLDKQGLTHYDSKLKTVVAGQMTIEGAHDHAEERLWCNARNGDDAADDL